MLVFISDIHLTDGSSGETINPGAFKKFAENVKDMARHAGAQRLEVVLLGDIFDVIRSDYWLRSPEKPVRPWSNEGDSDSEGKGLRDYTLEIVKRICERQDNKESVGYLKGLKDALEVPVTVTYIMGNHDWLINRYPDAREMIAGFLGMGSPGRYRQKKFDHEGFWDIYKVFARHGDIYDAFNFDGDRNASSLGDAIVIDLLNKFPGEVERELGNADHPLVLKLKEIDNVRPLMDIPVWVQGVCRRHAGSSEVAALTKRVWNDLVDEFLDLDFVRAHDKFLQPDIVDALEAGLKVTKYLSFKKIAEAPLRWLQRFEDDYIKDAFREDHRRSNQAEFVLFGHTHDYAMRPLDEVPLDNGRILKQYYFNTGTWRRVHMRTAFDPDNLEFLSWQVMTFVAFYQPGERKEKRFEVWNGALG